jgi:galacturonosyltransferase
LANITGLGIGIENRGIIQKIALRLYKSALKKTSCAFFQNKSNRLLFINKNIIGSKSRLIPGSGVNLEEHSFEEYPEDDKNIRFLFIGRIMKDKGIDELLEAAKVIKVSYPDVQFDVVGRLDGYDIVRLNDYVKKGIINYYGQQDDVHSFIKRSHAIVLPSYHEGLSNVLLESAASGRPVIASRVPGCVETFDEGLSGLGFDVKSVTSLVEVLIKFINLPYEKKKSMSVQNFTASPEEWMKSKPSVRSTVHCSSRMLPKRWAQLSTGNNAALSVTILQSVITAIRSLPVRPAVAS